VHPAFQITVTPLIILLAFIVLALSVLVISIIIRKFEEQLERIKQETSKVYKADVGRLSASAAICSGHIKHAQAKEQDHTYVWDSGHIDFHCYILHFCANVYAEQ
jgi:uncharacterized protein YpmS